MTCNPKGVFMAEFGVWRVKTWRHCRKYVRKSHIIIVDEPSNCFGQVADWNMLRWTSWDHWQRNWTASNSYEKYHIPTRSYWEQYQRRRCLLCTLCQFLLTAKLSCKKYSRTCWRIEECSSSESSLKCHPNYRNQITQWLQHITCRQLV